MFKKCLMLSCLFCVIFTIKSMAFTYDQNNPLNTGYDDYLNNQSGGFSFDWFDNLGLDYYDFFTYTTRTSTSGNVYTNYGNILYKNDDTKEIVFHNYFSTYYYRPVHEFYYVHDTTVTKINASSYVNGSNYSYGHSVLFFEKNEDDSLKYIYFLDQTNGTGSGNYSNQVTRIIFTNNNNIYSSALCSVYRYNVSSNNYTSLYSSGTSWTIVNAYDYVPLGLTYVPTYTTLCENNNNMPFSYSTILFNNNYDSIHSGECNGNWDNTVNNNLQQYFYYGNYADSQIIWSIIQTPTENIILHLEDSNLRQIFHFNFNLPKTKVDSVYYAFMNRYVRNTYNSVTGYFTVYELSTPPEYTGSFEKYMIYDEDGKYFTFVNGLVVKAYTGSCDSGGTFTFDTTEINVNSTIVNDFIACLGEYQMFHLENDGTFVKPSTNVLAVAYNSCQSLGRHLINNLSSGVIARIGLRPGQELTADSLKKLLYYSNYVIYNGTEFDDTNYYRLNDCCFATGNIYSYESTYSSKVFEHDFYNLIKNTIIRYSSKYQVSDNEYLITKVDGEDVSSLLPSGTDTTYLNSPVFKNTDSINGGYLLAQVEDVINGLKPINYNVEYSPVYNTYNENYISNYNDNLSPENTDYIDSTDSDSGLIKKFISHLKSIDDKLDNLKTNVSNTTNNFTESFQNFYIIDRLALKDSTDSFIETFNDSMGIIADIPSMALYFLGRFANLNNGAITLVIPEFEIFGTTLIENTTINFTELIESQQVFTYFHNLTLIATDCFLLFILIQLAKNAFEEVKR